MLKAINTVYTMKFIKINIFSKPVKDPMIPPPIIKASACFGSLFIAFKLAIILNKKVKSYFNL